MASGSPGLGRYLIAIPSHPTKSVGAMPVRPAQWRMKRTTASRVVWGTRAPFRAPQALSYFDMVFIISGGVPGALNGPFRSLAGGRQNLGAEVINRDFQTPWRRRRPSASAPGSRHFQGHLGLFNAPGTPPNFREDLVLALELLLQQRDPLVLGVGGPPGVGLEGGVAVLEELLLPAIDGTRA